MIDKKDLVSVRDLMTDDVSFIYATMLRGLYYGDTFLKEIPKDLFMVNYHKIISHLLDSSDCQVKVACLKDDISVILAYAILNKAGTMCHFVFTKSAWRKIGLAKSLVPSTVNMASNITKVGLSIMKKHNIVFNPFL